MKKYEFIDLDLQILTLNIKYTNNVLSFSRHYLSAIEKGFFFKFASLHTIYRQLILKNSHQKKLLNFWDTN